MKLGEIASRLGCVLEGPPDLEISGVAGMDEATEKELTFLSNPKYHRKLTTTRAAAIIVSPDVQSPGRAVLRSENPYLSFAKALELFSPPYRPPAGIHPTAVIDPTAKLGRNPSVGPYTVIEAGAVLGDDCVLKSFVMIYRGAKIGHRFLAHSHAVVREFCRVGHRVILQNGVVIGGDGFGFAKRADGTHYKIVQSGPTIIEDDVEVQSLTSVDRATVGETRVKRGAKIDSLVQIGHACVVGEDNIICAQVGLAGSSVLERNVLLAGQVGVSGHLTVHDNAVVYAQSGIGGDVDAGAVISGSPAFEAREWLRAVTAFPKLPELVRSMRELKKRLERLEGAASAKEPNS